MLAISAIFKGEVIAKASTSCNCYWRASIWAKKHGVSMEDIYFEEDSF